MPTQSTSSSGSRDLVGNNTRFLVLPEASGIPNLASRALGRSLRRLCGDWSALHGHPLERASADKPVKAHGRVEARRVDTCDLLPRTLGPFP